MINISFILIFAAALVFPAYALSDDLEGTYNSRQQYKRLEKESENRAINGGIQFSCPYAGTFTFIDGFAFSGSSEGNLVPLGKYSKKGKNVISFSWSQIDRYDNTMMNVKAELNIETQKLYKVFNRSNPARDDGEVLKTECKRNR